MGTDRFTVEPHGHATALVRHATPATGTPYRHSCPFDAFEKVVFAIEDLEDAADGGFTGAKVILATGLPSSQVAAALAFLWERGIVERRGKQLATNPRKIYVDAMIEYWAMFEEPRQLV